MQSKFLNSLKKKKIQLFFYLFFSEELIAVTGPRLQLNPHLLLAALNGNMVKMVVLKSVTFMKMAYLMKQLLGVPMVMKHLITIIILKKMMAQEIGL